ncbi:uncharacterized protein LOC115216764 [Octopus sinensis]|uniref:Uncharacterized protein LOC115216764 n=1 Tax=Octopus sinensis TaxID=2607531 RepID=A0A6P7SVC4_9MOLL|nr:uncharacterized protein LOC115216764 [Octopus sinensis]XP_029642187.1 uncharacterized protein LOC115216764 [Octopus sinensis]XP_029642188.1 uncharacterized protein LOC115216764 [Octopus sinensis]XP_029642191.1 uncharacterized protein LOC115216764 [Octopus sinensis]XP_029642192.1 uncharacterized protein LOC115216764 [Octopus sinensis]XP_036362707.1 uncharacterized protein LOC115216764 [Octopus sinensis]
MIKQVRDRKKYISSKMSRIYLPKISKVSTPVFHRSCTNYSKIFGPYPPKELTKVPSDKIKIPPRINPLKPLTPKKRINMHWETYDQHWQNEHRSLRMRQKEHTRYHNAWEKPFYGQPAEKEAYRKHIRDVLKAQMADRDRIQRKVFQERKSESDSAIEYDQKCWQEDLEKSREKISYLIQFRDQNKQLMEQKWRRARDQQNSEKQHERDLLRYNPINWSGTLS